MRTATTDSVMARIGEGLAGSEVAADAEGTRETSAPAVIAFDGDGTLWSGDVGDDFLEALIAQGALRDAVTAPLANAAVAHGLSPQGSAVDIAKRIVQAHAEGAFSEVLFYEVTAWLCAGWERGEVHRFAADVLTRGRFLSRLHREAIRILEWAFSESMTVFLVSASPRPIVEQAAALLGLAPERVIAVTPLYDLERDVMLADVARPIPYGPGKVAALAEQTRGARLLAAFGDNGFDVPMLQSARIPVAVRPKARLRERATDVPGLVELIAE